MENRNNRPAGASPPTPPGLLVRQRLHELKMTEQELADGSGERLETINRIICVRGRLTPAKAVPIAAALGLPPKLLLDAQLALDLWRLGSG